MRSNPKLWVLFRELRYLGGHFQRATEFLRSEVSPFAKRNAEHTEIIRRHKVHSFLNRCRAPVRRTLRIGAPSVIAFQRKRLSEGRPVYPWQALHASQKLVVEGAPLWHCGISGIRKYKCHRQYAFRSYADVGAAQPRKSTQQQACAN